MTTGPAAQAEAEAGPHGGVGGAARTLAAATGRRHRSPRTDRVVLAVTATVFVVATFLAARSLPDESLGLRPLPLVLLALLAVPATTAANALEYVVAARIEGQRVPPRRAVEVSVLSSAANLLPLPGAALVRVQALRHGGATARRALSVTVAVGGAWLATSLVLAGGTLALVGPSADRTTAAAVLAVGVAALGVTLVGVRRLAPRGHAASVGVALVGAEVVAVAVGAVRYLLVFAGLGLGMSVAQSVALTVAGVLAAAAGLVPGGLGIREALAGVIAAGVDLPAAAGVLATGVDRLVGLPVLGVLALALGLRRPRGVRYDRPMQRDGRRGRRSWRQAR